MRGLLVVNPNATTTTPRAREVLIGALAHQVDLETVTTDHRGHAAELGAKARREGIDVVIALGGDGTANETINGMLSAGPPGPDLPIFGIVPGGSANVLCRTLGFSPDPIEATGALISSLRDRNFKTISLGRANDRWFTCNAGLGMDAEIVAAMEKARAAGKTASPTRYFVTTVRQFFATDRKHPNQVVLRPGQDPVHGVYLSIVQNCSPWTYLGVLPVNPNPQASFDEDLDLWALRRMRFVSGLRFGRRMLMSSKVESSDGALMLHDEKEFTIYCHRPTALQVDGEGLGEVTEVRFTSHRQALRVVVSQAEDSSNSTE